MNKYSRIFQILFAFPWIVFGIQHFMYAEFVATLVPAFMPFKSFWVYLTGTAMIAAGISLIVDKLSALAALSLGSMLAGFIGLIHLFVVAGDPADVKLWTRPAQDVALAAACLLLAGSGLSPSASTGARISEKALKISRFVFALMLLAFGVQQFFDLDFVTAKVPLFVPARMFWVYLTGAALIAAAGGVIIDKKARRTAFALGFYLLAVNFLNYGVLLAKDLHNPQLWTALMLNWALTVGVFILANSLPPE